MYNIILTYLMVQIMIVFAYDLVHTWEMITLQQMLPAVNGQQQIAISPIHIHSFESFINYFVGLSVSIKPSVRNGPS